MARDRNVNRQKVKQAKSTPAVGFLGSTLFRRRNQLQYSTYKAAQIAGCSPEAWHAWETGEDVPSQFQVRKIAMALLCHVDELMGGVPRDIDKR